jgi:hypothetical protein
MTVCAPDADIAVRDKAAAAAAKMRILANEKDLRASDPSL